MHQMDNFSAIGSHISNQNHNKNHQEQQIEQHLSRAPSAMDPLMTGTLQSQVTQVRTLKSVMNKGFTDLGKTFTENWDNKRHLLKKKS